MSSAVQCVISHWGAGFAVQLVQEADPSNRTRYSNMSSPIIEFHGDKDTSVPFASALAVEKQRALEQAQKGSGFPRITKVSQDFQPMPQYFDCTG